MLTKKKFSGLRAKFILIFISLSVGAVIASTAYTTYLYKDFAVKRAAEQASVDVLLISSKIESLLKWVIRDLFFLRDLPQLQRYVRSVKMHKTEREALLKSIEETFRVLAQRHGIYLQVRFINRNGMEKIRINFDGHVARRVPSSELQYKGKRYYFKEAMKLGEGQIYVSPMDLNIEHGKIERPFVPTIRYATVVCGRKGEKRGIIILNVLGKALLDILSQQQEKVARHGKNYYLIDSRGYYLYHPDPSKTFGFMFGNRETLLDANPSLMRLMKEKKFGSLTRLDDMAGRRIIVSFRKVALLTDYTHRDNCATTGGLYGKAGHFAGINGEHPFWVLFSTLDVSKLTPSPGHYPRSFFLVTALLIAGCGIVATAVALFVTRPLVSLATAAKKIQNGNLSARARIYSADEMGDFGKLFNSMASQLEETIGKLKASESKFRHLFEKSKDCFLVMDSSGKIINMNESCTSLFGLAYKNGGKGCVYIPIESEREQEIRKLNDLLASKGYVRDYEIHLRRSDGETIICLMTATALRDENGEITGCEGILRDITERRKRIQAKRDFQKRLREEVVMAEERERRNIGQILHEDVAQNLALVHIKIESAESSLECHGDEAINHLRESRKLLGRVIDRIRAMSFELYPPMLDREGLLPTIEWYARNFSERTGMPVTIYSLGSMAPLTRPQEVYLFRAFRELLHNVWKHAGANEIVVTLLGRDGMARLVVDDDGSGFNVDKALKFSQNIKGIGLFSIREWVTSMKGNFSIESSREKGTRVQIEIPVLKRRVT